MLDIDVIADPAAAEVSLDPIRARLLAELVVPTSATALGERVGLPRQKVNYHLKALEAHGLIELVEERRRGNCTERVLQSTARSYVISPAVLAPLAPDLRRPVDNLSVRWLLSLAGQLVRDVGDLVHGAAAARRAVPTLALDGEIRFGSAAARAAFVGELAGAIAALSAKYHDESARRGRAYRLVVAVHPSVVRADAGSKEN